eukprot:m.307240 g.307240  ORF g.307240 m.307240 type:complete len:287 (+) comp42050_c0_seq1:61-921(+)
MGKTESKHGWQGVDTAEPDVESTPELAKKKLMGDPRSPTDEILRTPIETDLMKSWDPRSPTEDILRTPLAVTERLEDPREPTEGIERTPLLTDAPTFVFQADILDSISEERGSGPGDGAMEAVDDREQDEEEAEDEKNVRYASSFKEEIARSLPDDENDVDDISEKLQKIGLIEGGKKRRAKSSSQSPRRSSYTVLATELNDPDSVGTSPSRFSQKRMSVPTIGSRKKGVYGKLSRSAEEGEDECERVALSSRNFDPTFVGVNSSFDKIGFGVGENEDSSTLVSVN